MRELYNPLDYGEAMGINDHGLAIGYMYRKGDYMFYPIAWRNGEYIEIINQPKIFGGLAAVNNNDQILGWEYYTNDLGKKVYAPAIWKDGEITRFPTIHSQQYWDLTGGFNNNGDILFSAYEGDMFGHRWNEEYYAVLGGTTYKFDDLLENKQAGLQYNAYRINDAGVIGGWTFDPQTGKTRAVLFSPVPEPLSLATLGLGLAICVGRRKTR
ncbi:MAG: PEP-CTERM sorting domain-containing protein [Armatimonadetes bacterium]|nr:PEP-CTERM sorting domain-containing protein [Armatimonadota bacterium]